MKKTNLSKVLNNTIVSVSFLIILFVKVAPLYPYIQDATLSPDSLYVGDQVTLAISLIVPPKADVTDNGTTAFTDPLVLLNSVITRKEGTTGDSITIHYLFTTFTYDTMSIDTIRLYVISQEKTDTLLAGPIPLHIVSAITAKEGDTITIKDIKPLMKAGKPSLLWLWIIIALIIAGVTTFLLFRKLKKEKAEKLPPPLPPYEEAMKLLSELDDRELVEKGLRREFVFELSEILKRYAGRRYSVNFPEFTTEEILAWLEKTALLKEPSDLLKGFFEDSHFVKFAGSTPDIATCKNLRERAGRVISITRPSPDTETPRSQEGS